MHVLIIGNSHIAALERAYIENPMLEIATGQRILAQFISFLSPEYAPNLKDEACVLNARTRQLVVKSRAEFIVSCIGGAEHILFGLVNHPRKFDFVLPEKPDLPTDKTVELLPCGLVRMVMERKMDLSRRILIALHSEASKPIVHLESPPPIREDHIKKHPTVFKEKIEQFGIAPATLRYKLWRLHSQIMRNLCSELGSIFVPVPSEAIDADGMMAARACGADAAHGSVWYGERVMCQLANVPHAGLAQGG